MASLGGTSQRDGARPRVEPAGENPCPPSDAIPPLSTGYPHLVNSQSDGETASRETHSTYNDFENMSV